MRYCKFFARLCAPPHFYISSYALDASIAKKQSLFESSHYPDLTSEWGKQIP